MTRTILDHVLHERITIALEEREMLRKEAVKKNYNDATYLFTVSLRDKASIQDFRALDRFGADMIPVRETEESIMTLLGEELVRELKRGDYRYDEIAPERFAEQRAFDHAREIEWWTDVDVLLSTTRAALKFNREFGVLLSQGDDLIGLFAHAGGFSRIGIASQSLALGVQLPVTASLPNLEERKLDGGIGGYAAFQFSDGRYHLRGSGFYQLIDKLSYTRPIDAQASYRAQWGAACVASSSWRLFSDAVISVGIGFCAYAVERGVLVDDRFLPTPIERERSISSAVTTLTEPIAEVSFLAPTVKSSDGDRYRPLSSSIGYTGGGFHGSIEYYPLSFLGLEVKGIYYLRNEAWLPKYILSVSPLLRIQL